MSSTIRSGIDAGRGCAFREAQPRTGAQRSGGVEVDVIMTFDNGRKIKPPSQPTDGGLLALTPWAGLLEGDDK